jgi:hypothetical protein
VNTQGAVITYSCGGVCGLIDCVFQWCNASAYMFHAGGINTVDHCNRTSFNDCFLAAGDGSIANPSLICIAGQGQDLKIVDTHVNGIDGSQNYPTID